MRSLLSLQLAWLGSTMRESMGCLLAAGNRAEVFEWGSRVMKLYRSAAAKHTAFREAAIHAAVEALGVPVPTVWSVHGIGDRWGVVFDRVSGVSFAEQMRDDAAAVPQYLQILAHLHTRIHAHPADQFSSLKLRLATNIARTTLLDEPRKQILLRGLTHMPDGDRLCHGDFHPMNVLGEASQPIVIDWPDACRGDPAGDVCRSYLILKLHADEVAGPYLDAYCRVSCVLRETILDWLPYVTAARLSEDIPGERARLLELDRSL
jgi:Ser/Thr protein kinase RdoA (MazF antagonist)